MISVTNGNILNCKEDIIIHQVNVRGIMGCGLARQLADQYPKLEKEYYNFCKEKNFNYDELKGKTYIEKCENKYIANIFSQKINFDTDYKMMKKSLKLVELKAKECNLSVAIPYGLGCGIANGNWNIVYKIIKEIFQYSKVKCTLYRLEV